MGLLCSYLGDGNTCTVKQEVAWVSGPCMRVLGTTYAGLCRFNQASVARKGRNGGETTLPIWVDSA